MSLLKLHPRILDVVRMLPPGTPERLVTERKLRPLARLAVNQQLAEAGNQIPELLGNRDLRKR